MTATVERPGALGMLLLEEAAAWQDYLDSTRDQPEHRYRDVEPWAFSRLCQRLKAINTRRNTLLEAVSENDGA